MARPAGGPLPALPRGLLCAVLAAVLGLPAADIAHDLYVEALRSRHMKALSLKDLDEFTGPDRPQRSVMVLFHEASCHICRDTLPKLEQAAVELRKKGVPVEVGHMDCSAMSVSSAVKQRFALQGFPSLLFWRELSSDQDPSRLVGKQLKVDADRPRLIRACRGAGMDEAKDAARLKALGMSGEAIEVDRQDMTAKLEIPNVGRIWLPLEVLRGRDGWLLPFRRSDAFSKCDARQFGGWRKEALIGFARRMSRPAVVPLDSLRQLAEDMRGEEHPAVVFCGAELPPAFRDIAASRQDTTRAYHAAELSACPSPEAPQLVLYSPAEQQWSARGTAPAAVLASGREVLEDAEALDRWVQAHRYAGLTRLDYHNFFSFAKSRDRVLVVALDTQDAEMNPRVERRLLQLASPSVFDDRSDVREFPDGKEDLSIGVIDGTLSGLETYGVSPGRLPHVVVMEGPDQWVEDAEELSIWGLPSSLKRLPDMWRFSHGLRGYLSWFLRQLQRSYSTYVRAIDGVAGTPGVRLFQGLLIATPATCLVSLGKAFRLLVAALLAEDPADPGRKED